MGLRMIGLPNMGRALGTMRTWGNVHRGHCALWTMVIVDDVVAVDNVADNRAMDDGFTNNGAA